MQRPMHVAKATELAFEGKPRPELLHGDDEAMRKLERRKMNAWDVANSSGHQAIRATTATSHYSHVYNPKFTTVYELWNYLVRTFQQTNPSQQKLATQKWLACM